MSWLPKYPPYNFKEIEEHKYRRMPISLFVRFPCSSAALRMVFSDTPLPDWDMGTFVSVNSFFTRFISQRFNLVSLWKLLISRAQDKYCLGVVFPLALLNLPGSTTNIPSSKLALPVPICTWASEPPCWSALLIIEPSPLGLFWRCFKWVMASYNSTLFVILKSSFKAFLCLFPLIQNTLSTE